MQYDIASKVLIEKCREEILRRFLGLSVTESTILEQPPQETVSVKRSDFPILVTDETGKQQLVLLEIQTQWERKFPIRLLDYIAFQKMFLARLEGGDHTFSYISDR